MPVATRNTPRIPAIDLYIANAAPFAQPILLYLRDLVHEAVPGIEEQIKWSRPFFVLNGVILGNISAFKHHCTFGLWGTEIANTLRADGVASAEAMGTFGRITMLEELPPRRKLVAYIRNAARLIAEGTRTKSIDRPARPARPKTQVAKPIDIPPAFATALKLNPTAARHFDAMSPSCRREYSTWIAEAKRDTTRDARIATALEWIAEGKARHWKYESK